MARSLTDFPLSIWIRNGLVPVAKPEMTNAKRGVTDSYRELWLSDDMMKIAWDERDPLERAKMQQMIDVRVVSNLKREWKRAAFGPE